jgi:hypothetical protein
MADVKPTAVKATTSTAHAKKSSNAISWIAPIACIVLGYVIWRYVFGAASNFEKPDTTSWFCIATRFKTQYWFCKNVRRWYCCTCTYWMFLLL